MAVAITMRTRYRIWFSAAVACQGPPRPTQRSATSANGVIRSVPASPSNRRSCTLALIVPALRVHAAFAIGWAVSASRLNYDGRIVVGKRPLLHEWAVRVSLEVFDGSVDETNSQGVVHRFLVVVARGVTCPSDQTVRGDVGIHSRAERCPHLGMAVGKTD